MSAVLTVVAIAIGWAVPTQACTICIPLPEQTAADHLIESEVVALAREDPARPFAYAPVEVLKGTVDGPIDLFLNSATRRRLAASPNDVVVLARRSAADGWRSLGYANTDYEAVVREIVRQAWRSPDDLDRLAYFAELLGHDNRTIAELAYLEIGRAPYGTIRSVSDRIPVEVPRTFLRSMTYYDWRPLAILMLAQSDHAEDRDLIRRSFEAAQRSRARRHLAAWTTAYIEIDGAEAIDRIDDLYFRDPSRSPAELGEVVQASSVHGTDGHVHLRPRIVAGYMRLLQTHRAMLGAVVQDLAAWQEWDLAPRVREVADAADPLDQQTLFALGYYLGLAAEGDVQPERAAVR